MAKLVFGDKRSIELLESLRKTEHEALAHQIECPNCRRKKYVEVMPYTEQLRMTQLKLRCSSCPHEFYVGRE